MRNIFKTFLILLALGAPASALAMKDLYVDTDSGSNANACTATGASACATLAGAVGKLPASLITDDSYTIHCKGATQDASAVSISGHDTDATHIGCLNIQA